MRDRWGYWLLALAALALVVWMLIGPDWQL